MDKLLEKVKEYGEAKGIEEPSLYLEVDGSGFIHCNLYYTKDAEIVFGFDTLEELYKEVGYSENEMVVCIESHITSYITEGKHYPILAEGGTCYLIEDDSGDERHVYKKYFKKL